MQRLNSDIGTIAAWLEKTEAELEALRLAEPPSNVQEMALTVKKLQVSGSPGGEGRGNQSSQSLHCGAEQTDQAWVWCSWQHAGNVCREVVRFHFSKDGHAGFSLHMGENLRIIAKPRRALLRCGSDPKSWKDLDFRFLRRCW